ncbi:MAG: helix-hairpin-helix domain-containing protein [candidate division WOR-3 bacterium]
MVAPRILSGRVLGVIGVLLVGLVSGAGTDFQKIRIVATADMWCRVVSSSDFAAPGLPRRMLGGWANLARLIRETRTEATLVLDCGGFAFGSPEGQATQGRAAVRFMNLVRYDAAALGARDFSGGVENVEVMAKLASFPILADPMLDVVLGRRAPLFRPFLVKDVSGVRVALVGLSDPFVQRLNRKADIRGFAADELTVQVRRYLAAVRAENPDIVVAFGHIAPESGAALLDSFPELDIVVCPARAGTGSRRGLVQVGTMGQRVQVADILFHRSERRVYEVEQRELNVVVAAGDSMIQRLSDEVLVAGMDSVECYVTAELLPDDSSRVLGMMVCEAVRTRTGADLVLLPWAVLGSGLGEGPQMRRALFGAVPFCERVRLALMADTTLHKLVASFKPEEPFPMLAGADLFVIGDTAGWPAASRVARLRLCERKPQYRVATTEQVLEQAGLAEPGRLVERNLTELWLEWASTQDTIRPVSGPKLYPAGAGLVVRPESAAFPININTASVELLEQLPGIGPMTARRIVEYREEHGRFSSVDDLLNVKGIGPKKLEAIRPLATVR